MAEVLNFVFLILAFIVAWWMLIEVIGYVPTNVYVPDWFSKIKESFIASNIDRRLPAYSGDDIVLSAEPDTNILRVNRNQPGVLFSKTEELDFYKMNSLIIGMFKLNQNMLDTQYSINPLYTNYKIETGDEQKFVEIPYDMSRANQDTVLSKILLHFRMMVNREVLMSEFNSPYHAFEPFVIKHFSVSRKYVAFGGKYTKYNINVECGRDNKINNCVFFISVIVNPTVQDDFIQYKIIEIIGTPVEHQKQSLDYAEQEKIGKYEPSLDDVFVNNDITGGPGRPNDDITVFQNKIKYDEDAMSYRCFHPNGNDGELPYYYTKNHCESYHAELGDVGDGNIGGVGVWDNPCKSNSDCPFYQANTNYPNEFGKCEISTGKCEMPLGIQRIGYKKYSRRHKPMCYNCNMDMANNNILSTTQCCDIQEENIKNGKLNAITPDYMFEGDHTLRRENSASLLSKDLEANPTI